MTRPWTASRGLRPADYDRTDVRVLDDTNARVELRLARLPAEATHRGPGPAQAMEPAVVARCRRAGRHARARVRVPAAACRRFFVDRHNNIVIEAALCRKFLVINRSVAHIT